MTNLLAAAVVATNLVVNGIPMSLTNALPMNIFGVLVVIFIHGFWTAMRSYK